MTQSKDIINKKFLLILEREYAKIMITAQSPNNGASSGDRYGDAALNGNKRAYMKGRIKYV